MTGHEHAPLWQAAAFSRPEEQLYRRVVRTVAKELPGQSYKKAD
jgi:hypothetical protein